MQSGLGWLAAHARRVGIDQRFGRVGVLLVGLAVTGCAGGGQIANLTDARGISVAFESLDGPPAPVSQRLMKSLKGEAGARQITVVATGQANFRVRGYLAAHEEGTGTTISWVLDAYDAGQHRAFRLSGEERASGHMWTGTDDGVLQRIARVGMDQFVAYAATSGVGAAPSASSATGAATVAAAAAQRPSTALGWADDGTPESAGIFRISRPEGARAPKLAAEAVTNATTDPPWPAGTVPLPRGRPAGEGTGSGLGYAPEDR